MKNFDDQVLELITSKLANTKALIMATTHVEVNAAENVLRRLKSKGKISFDKTAELWVATAMASQESAPTGDSEVVSVNTESAATTPEDNKKEITMQTENTSSETSVDSIDAAIAAAKSGTTASKDKTSRPRLSAEEKLARDAARTAEQAEKKANRDAARLAKAEAKKASAKPAHMSKVEKAANKLPSLDDSASSLFGEITVNYTRDQITALAAHLTHFNRMQATERALGQKVKTGDSVRITGGDARFVGKTGTVAKAQRIRCYVTVEGVAKDVYLFTSDVEVLSSESAVKSA